MKNQELQSALNKSGIFMVLCIFFIYAFAVGDSGGIAGTIGSIFSGILFLLGLIFAVAVSVIVMFGIYFGILYMYDKEVCKKTYAEFKSKLADSSKALNIPCSSKCSTTTETVAVAINDEDLNPLRSNQDKLNNQLSELQSSVTTLEQTLNSVSSSVADVTTEMSKLDSKAATIEEELQDKATTSAIDDSAKKLTGEITTLQNSIKPLSDKLSELETTLSSLPGEGEDKGDEIQKKLDTTVNGMKNELKEMQEAIKALATQPEKKGAETNKPEHKLLAYFNNKNDEKQFVALVNEAVAKEMTYAQAGEFLTDSLSKAASKVISGHPSLTKDYIKVIRKRK
ncbi:MAG: hypothetical protein U9R57_10565 [Thermodesulfobacteriota bacterium]|nr:hypothetical protein [Thermodesulfobacteriota bacterium]